MMLNKDDKDKIDKWFDEHTIEELLEKLIEAGYKPDDIIKVDEE